MKATTSFQRQRVGFWLGLFLFGAFLFLPLLPGISPSGQKVLAIAALMAVWWISEAIPLYITSLIPMVAFPAFGIIKASELSSSYGHHFIFLFMGGFFIAKAIEKWNLHERIALSIISVVGTSPKRIIMGLMLATAFLSMWISDTATTMVMFPIAMAILHHMDRSMAGSQRLDQKNYQTFATCLLLSVAYASLIGGVATLIGTPPNIVFAGAIKTLYPEAPEITFFQWMKVGVPLTIVFLPLTWWYLTHVALPVKIAIFDGGKEAIQSEIKKLGRMSSAEKRTLAVFFLAILGWVFRKDIVLGTVVIPGWSNLMGLENNVNDTTVAIFAACLLFVIPANSKRGGFLLDWGSAVKIPWGILILFGGGLALASAVKSSGLSQWIGEGLRFLSGFPILLMVLSVCLMMTFLTEVTSNTATATIFMPILGSIAVAMDINPMLFMIPAAMSASCAFMLPVATPPNAIVFSSGRIPASKMALTGLGLNLVGLVLITMAVYLLAIPAFGILFNGLPSWAQP